MLKLPNNCTCWGPASAGSRGTLRMNGIGKERERRRGRERERERGRERERPD